MLNGSLLGQGLVADVCTYWGDQVWENTPGCGEAPFLDTLWTAIDEAVNLQDCDVYSYKSDGETDPFGMARTLCLTCCPDRCLCLLFKQ